MSNMSKGCGGHQGGGRETGVSRSRCCPLPRSQSEQDIHIQAHTYILSPQESYKHTHTPSPILPISKNMILACRIHGWREEMRGKILNFVLLSKPTFCPEHIWGCNSIFYSTPKSQRLKKQPLGEDLGSLSSTLTTICNSSSRGFDAVFWLLRALHTHEAWTQRQHKYARKIKINLWNKESKKDFKKLEIILDSANMYTLILNIMCYI